jgi:hypothetical protein
MRLTLRTLLAYLDDVLNPGEAEQLRQRIEESEFASTLVQRIRHTVRRLRLSAPKIDGRGLGFDPNSVAEYLDSTMSAERVADFEKVCLESDVHLAEVAACHQILAKVLSEPAQVPDELRARIHALPSHVPPPPPHAEGGTPSQNGAATDSVTAPPVTVPPVAAAATVPPVERPKPQVPDYLKPEPKRPAGVWGALALLGAIAAAVLFFLPPLNQYNPLLKNPANNPEIAQNDATTSPDNEPVVDETPREDSEMLAAPAPDEDEPPVEKTASQGKTKDSGGDIEPAAFGPALSVEKEKMPEKPDVAVAVNDRATEVVEKPVKPATDEMPEETKPVTPAPETPAPEPAPVEAPTPPPALGAELGRFISDETLLATFDEPSHNWMRVPARSLIVDGQRCVSLPVYRPQIALSSGVQITMVGETTLQFGRATDREIPRLTLESGRLLLHSIALPNVKTELNLDGIRGTLTLDTADSEAAIQVYGYLPPGGDPLLGDNFAVAHIFSVNGTVTWQQEGREPVTLKTNHMEELIADEAARRRGPIRLPAWIDPRNTSTLDRDAAKLIEPLLTPDRPLVLALRELATHRRLDVRVHVARCLAYLGQYEALVRQLSQEEYRSYWMRQDGHIDMLRRQIARGGLIAERMQEELVEVRGERDGQAIFRLLQGYSEQQLLAGAADTLVQALAHPNMDIRVLAIDNLNRITGATHLYNAALSPEKSRPRILKWQELLKDGAITYTAATKPSPSVDFERLSDPEAAPKEK